MTEPTAQVGQLTLEFSPQLTEQYRSLKDCIAARMHMQRGGLRAVAGRLDMSPSHLSEVLGGGGERNRKFDLDELEAYVREFKDVEPILYLCAKFLGDRQAEQAVAANRVQEQLQQLIENMAKAGMTPGKRRR